MKLFAFCSALFLAWALPAMALAQSPAVAMFPVVTPLRLGQTGEPTSNGGALPASLAVLPLRLTLMGDAFPLASSVLGGCASREEASGNSIDGFAVQRATAFSLTPRLTLHGFSRIGCSVDAGLGGGLSYAMPLQRDIWLIGSVGFFAQPDLPSSKRVHESANLDLMVNRPSGRAYGVGVDAAHGRFTFTGTW